MTEQEIPSGLCCHHFSEHILGLTAGQTELRALRMPLSWQCLSFSKQEVEVSWTLVLGTRSGELTRVRQVFLRAHGPPLLARIGEIDE